MRKRTFWQQVQKNKTLLYMLLPALLYVIIFSYIPMFGITIAFKNYNYNDGIMGSPWCGLQNLISENFWKALGFDKKYIAVQSGFYCIWRYIRGRLCHYA